MGPESVPPPSTAPAKPERKGTETNGVTSTQAKLVVDMPADAKLFVDDQLMKSTAARREFKTPVLETGATYYYILRAEMVVDGQTRTQTKQVILRAGDVIQTSFPELQRLASVRVQASAARQNLP